MCQVLLYRIIRGLKISTHTLTWSVTYNFVMTAWIIVFQLTRSRGAWRIWLDGLSVLFHFNSHAHVERDCRKGGEVMAVSDFNSHAHVERDHSDKDGKSWIKNFNSHAHVERDYRPECCKGYLQNFNSHAHVERDLCVVFFKKQPEISTHTLTWSVTATLIAQIALIVISTHTLTWSVTRKPLNVMTA